MRGLIILAAAAACMGAPAWADDNESDESRDNELVCKRERGMNTGSHLSRATRVCRTRAEWRELEQMTEREIRQFNDRGRVEPPRGSTARNE